MQPADPQIEHPPSEQPPLREAPNFAVTKIAVFQYAAVAIFLFLISGFWSLQIQNNQLYDERAQANSIKSIPILAPRGRILDRDGRVIVDNHSSFSLILARETLKEEHLSAIAQGLDLDYTDLRTQVARFRSQPKYVPIVVKEELTPADLAFVESHRDFFPEMVLIQAQRRLYPQNGMLAHVIGYTGQISEEELDDPEFAKYSPGQIIGKFGIEREYNDWMTGVDGERQVVVDNRGQVKQVLATKPYVPGKDLKLTIDLDLQVVAELGMDAPQTEVHVEHTNGAVVALDPRTGEVLATVSRPTFDPNKFAVRIKSRDWKEIADNPEHPLHEQGHPGATAAGLHFQAVCGAGGPGKRLHRRSVHRGLPRRRGPVWPLPEVLGVTPRGTAGSPCTGASWIPATFISTPSAPRWGSTISPSTATWWASAIPPASICRNEKEGVMPSPQWKLRNYRQKWYAGETPSVAIGQGA